jgi:hypothetical protein
VSAFVLAEAARRSAGSLNNVTTGLRALLRWLYVRGVVDEPGQRRATPARRSATWTRASSRESTITSTARGDTPAGNAPASSVSARWSAVVGQYLL